MFERLWRLEVGGTPDGHVDDPLDRGGETKYGISLRFLKALNGIDVDQDGFADLDLNFDTVIDGHDVRALTPEIAEYLFKDHFYIGPGFWSLPMPFDLALSDQGANAGVTAAIKLLQRAVNTAEPNGLPLSVDGRLGPKTRGGLRDALARGRPVLAQLRLEAERRYEAIVAADPTQRRFLNGWRNRARELGRV